jgi:hypothetical protein
MTTAEQRREQQRRSIIQQLQERNQGLEDSIERLQIELNLNRQIIEEFFTDGGAYSKEYSTSVESIEDISSIEIIPATTEKDRKPKARVKAQAQLPVSTLTTATPKQKRKNKKEERKESFERARAWALDCSQENERKRNEYGSK